MESKSFEVKVEEKKGKLQATIVEGKKGISSWIRLGPVSLGLFFDCLVLCIKGHENWKMGKKVEGKREGLFTGARSKQGGLFPPVRCCGPGEQKV